MGESANSSKPDLKCLKSFCKAESVEEIEKLLFVPRDWWQELGSVTKSWEEAMTLIKTRNRVKYLSPFYPQLLLPLLHNLCFDPDVERHLLALINANQGFKLQKDFEDVLCFIQDVSQESQRMKFFNLLNELIRTIDDHSFCNRASKELSRVEKSTSLSLYQDFPLQVMANTTHLKSLKSLVSSTFTSEDGYIRNLVGLVAEDFCQPLRDSLQNFQDGREMNDATLYGRVKIVSCNQVGPKIVCQIEFLDKLFNFKQCDWETSDKFMAGSLVCLLPDNTCRSVSYGVVHDRALLKECVVGISLLEPLSEELLTCQNLSLIEPRIYFEAYTHVIASLLAKRHVPFKELFALGQPLVDQTVPDHLTWKSHSSSAKPSLSPNNTVLNPAQLEALKMITKRKVCLIQGPPGTGKSFLGKKVVSFLLENSKQMKRKGPILICCFTNRALDAFLADVLPITSNVIRIGGGSTSDELKEKNLFTIKTERKLHRRAHIFQRRKYLKAMIETQESTLKTTLDAINQSLERGVLDLNVFTSADIQVVDSDYQWQPKEWDSWLFKQQPEEDSWIGGPWRTPLEKRKEMYKNACTQLCQRLSEMEKRLEALYGEIEDLNNLELVKILSEADVVGITTTGAAKRRSLVEGLGASIVIMEEAGQVMEGHSIAAIPSSCQQLISFGDHQQLRPTVACHQLTKSHDINVSLFERLIVQGFPFSQLTLQHRMRPEISRMIKNIFYNDLEDAKSVLDCPKVKGIASNCYFIAHTGYQDMDDGKVKSKTNTFEALFVVGLAKFLIEVGHDPRKITILAPYVGQWALISRLISATNGSDLSKVTVVVVDNYQGQENDIVLLSLVRGGPGGIGFLSEATRTCVALTRAKHGLFIVGNIQSLSSQSTVWTRVQEYLEERGMIGSSLSLVCPNHSSFESKVSDPKGFSNLDRCSLSCEAELRCGHVCSKPCHMKDRSHSDEFRCELPCSKACAVGHSCAKVCWEACHPCLFTAEGVLACGHKGLIKCESLRIPSSCETPVQVTLPCGHETILPCQERSSAKCREICNSRLSCGHPCQSTCHPDQKHSRCTLPCTRLRPGCRRDHKCLKLCYETCLPCQEKVVENLPCGHVDDEFLCSDDPSSFSCSKKCTKTLPCGHACKGLCYEDCPPCATKITTNTCNHPKTLKCSDVNVHQCQEPCTKVLSCGHSCPNLCSEECGGCQALVESDSKGSCGHVGLVRCGTNVIGSCQAECGKQMICGHVCLAKCEDCIGGQLHEPCKETCKRPLICGHQCSGICGQPCPPCKLKCLITCQHQICKAKCDDDACTPCKEKCQSQCEHVSCKKRCSSYADHLVCVEPCPLFLDCGHQCLGFCSEPCPFICGVCQLNGDVSKRYIRLSCGHSVVKEVLEDVAARTVGVVLCHECNSVIEYDHHRLRKLVFESRKRIASVQNQFYRQKLKLRDYKQDLSDALQDPSVNPRLKKDIKSALESKKSVMNLQDALTFKTKLLLLTEISQAKNHIPQATTSVIQTPFIGLQYLEDLFKFLATAHNVTVSEDTKRNIPLLCFSRNKWSICEFCSSLYFSYFAPHDCK